MKHRSLLGPTLVGFATLVSLTTLTGCNATYDHPAFGLDGSSGPLGVHNNPSLKHMTPHERQRYANEWHELQDRPNEANDDAPAPPPLPKPPTSTSPK